MTRILAHRANFAGPGSGENRREAIRVCVRLGFDIELDVWAVGGSLWAGHDGPIWECDPCDLRSMPGFVHAKNINAALILATLHVPYFCLERDQFAVTSTGEIWTNYGAESTTRSILCSPELVGASEPIPDFFARMGPCAGVCTDYPALYEKLIASEVAVSGNRAPEPSA